VSTERPRAWRGLVTPRSFRTRLLLWLAVPLMLFLGLDAWAHYQAALRTAQRAYDRLLVTSAHALADLIRLERGQLMISLPHAALEIYDSGTEDAPDDAQTRGRMVYRVSFLDGSYLAGDADLTPYTGRPASHPLYRSMIELYNLDYEGKPMRMAALLQPVESYDGSRLVVVQVGESAAYRVQLAHGILRATLQRQLLLLLVLMALIWLVATVALRPLAVLARQLDARPAQDLAPIPSPDGPRELRPLIAGFNGLLRRLAGAQELQRRFVADASHQLRTPLAVLQLQADAGLRGDLAQQEALQGIASTTRRATHLAEQLLSLARAQQSVSHEAATVFDLRDLLSEVVVALSPLIAQKHLDFQLDAQPCPVTTHRWMVHEIVSNLLKNAIEHTPARGALGVRLVATDGGPLDVEVWDSGPGLSPTLQERVFTPFATDPGARGTGLGLAICHDLAQAIGASLVLTPHRRDDKAPGLLARLRWGQA
jgi:two-component system sensor histidine kinase TctE